MPIYEFKCRVCGESLEVVQTMNDKHEASHCGINMERIFYLPQTNKDLMYQFVAHNIGHKPIQIYSRRQYNNLLKKQGLVTVSKNDKKWCLKRKSHIDSYHKEKAKKAAGTILRETKAANWCRLKESPEGKDIFKT